MSDPRAAAVEDRRQGMQDKADYLAGEALDKQAFRAVLARGESGTGKLVPQPISARNWRYCAGQCA